MPASGFETIYRGCDCCGQSYVAKTADIRRGWGRCCSKSCAAKLRERSNKSTNYKRSTVQKSQHDAAIKQRNELLAALYEIIALPKHPMRKKAVEIAEAAITNAEKQS